MAVWFIHGAFASSKSFTWIKEQLGVQDAVCVDYSCTQDLKRAITEVCDAIAQEPEPVDIVAHSLGGIIAAIAARRTDNVRKIVTLSTPFGGSRIAAFLQFITPGNFMESIQPYSSVITEARQELLTTPTLCIITTGGRSPMIPEANDGVVTLSSQKSIDGPTMVELPVNHFEVLLDKDAVALIRDFLWPTVRNSSS